MEDDFFCPNDFLSIEEMLQNEGKKIKCQQQKTSFWLKSKIFNKRKIHYKTIKRF